ncbi:hypothetical protein [Nonomuraea guangzhouensis]|uniref:Thioesterase family protein n=1 Tax=Nonomuraea guangzhouensis TaxID=1291555 RepID=A0ABW4GG08_9ACTN|nr:hypothetical protein [Nonomuraea guangzhouensis]
MIGPPEPGTADVIRPPEPGTADVIGPPEPGPAPRPARVRLRPWKVGGDRIDETAGAWDDKGRLVARSTRFVTVRVPIDGQLSQHPGNGRTM